MIFVELIFPANHCRLYDEMFAWPFSGAVSETQSTTNLSVDVKLSFLVGASIYNGARAITPPWILVIEYGPQPLMFCAWNLASTKLPATKLNGAAVSTEIGI